MKKSVRPRVCSQKLHALAAKERLKIFCFLRQGAHNVTEIAEVLGTTLVDASHHISVLRQAGLIRGKKSG